jgi:predicted deacylase
LKSCIHFPGLVLATCWYTHLYSFSEKIAMTFPSASNSNEELLQIARNAIVAGHRATAARMVNRVLESDPANKDAWRLLADCLSDPDAKQRCLAKAGDLPVHPEKTNFTTERFTVTPSGRVEAPPAPSEAKPEPVIVPPRKYKPTSRAESPSGNLRKDRSQQGRIARTRKTDPKRTRKQNSGGIWGFILFLLLAAVMAGGFFYLRGDISLDNITTLLFPSSQSPTVIDEAVSDLIPPDTLPEADEEVPEPNQPQDDANADLGSSASFEKVFQIGQSVQGRAIEVFQFGSGETQRLIVAGMHGGNEYNTIDLADELIAHIRANPEIIPADKTLFILRNLNPDGETRGHNLDGRTNENGVDLNRNWDSNWKIDWNRTNCWVYRPVTGGPFPNSEPETQALFNFIQRNNIDAVINYHSAALGIFPGGQPYAAMSMLLSEQLHEATGYPYPPIDIGCEYTGMFTDWAADYGIAAADVELTNHRDTDLEQNLKAMHVLLAWDPFADPKSLSGAKSAYPGGDTQQPESVLTSVKESTQSFFLDVYGKIMGRFEER